LGWDPPAVSKWKVVMEVVPLEKSDDMRWNELFNVLGRAKADPGGNAAAALPEAAKGFTFADVLDLRGGPAVKYLFNPTAKESRDLGDRVRSRFSDLPK